MKSKGTAAEDRSKKLMESRGYMVEKARAKVLIIKGRYISMSYDFFSAFDLFCVCGTDFKMVQVKSSKTYTHPNKMDEARQKILAVPAPKGARLLHEWKKNEKGRWELMEEIL